MPRKYASSPFVQFDVWMEEAVEVEVNDPNAMVLATATPEGRPSVRTVLLKGVDPRGFVFFTNTASRKGAEMSANKHVAVMFYWKSLHRQIRIEGQVEDVTDAEADAYFATRARVSRLGAWASDQSRPLLDRTTLQARLDEMDRRFPDVIPRPAHWSGYRLLPVTFEFWQDMPYRLHDRTFYFRNDGGTWVQSKLFP